MEFVRSLLLIDGLNGITAASRFTIHVEIGRCFDGREVGTAIARTVHQHCYPTEEPADRDFGESLSTVVELLSIVEVETGDRYDSPELCAEAWIPAVGLARQEALREQLDAPEAVVEAQGNREMIAEELLDIPAGFGPITGYLYDNLVETWLIELGWDDTSDGPLDSEQASGSEPG